MTLPAIGILLLINLVCHIQSLSGYFAADDFVHVSYLYDVFHGHPGRLLENFTGNWMQTLGTQFYRPLISLTLALDYWLGGGKEFAFHLSNLIYQTGCSIFLFLTTRRLFSEYGQSRALAVAFVAGALFAAMPIHVEVVNWVIGRVDSVCLFFFLASTWLYLRFSDSNKYGYPAGALACFALSLLSKEPAAILPPVLVLFEAFKPNRPDGQPATIVQRLRTILRKTWPFWLLLAVYLAVRVAALGTLVGGYTGSVGEGFNNSVLHRLFGEGSFARIIFPFNSEVFAPGDKTPKLLSIVYALIASAFALRFFSAQKAAGVYRNLLLAAGWAVLAILPVLQVFNITQTLQCSRFAYAFSAPLCIILALCLVPLWKRNAKPTGPSRVADALAVILTIFLISIYTVIDWRNNLPWQEAADQMRDFRAAVEGAVARTAGEGKILLLSVPDKTRGAHMIYNSAMLSVLLTEPLTAPGIAKRVISFEPVTFGDSNLISVSRLRHLLAQSPGMQTFSWSINDRKLVALKFEPHVTPDTIPSSLASRSFEPAILLPAVTSTSSTTTRFLSPRIDTPALGTGFVECELTCTVPDNGSQAYAQLFWSGKTDSGFKPARSLSLLLNGDGKPHIYRFPVAQNKSWLCCQEIQRLCLEVNARGADGSSQQVSQLRPGYVRMIDDTALVPRLSIKEPGTPGNDGICQITESSTFSYDASNVEGARSVIVELSAPNSWFEHYTGALHDTELSDKALKRIPFKELKGEFTIHPKDLPASGFYQVRTAALSTDGKIVGYTSAPINLQVSR